MRVLVTGASSLAGFRITESLLGKSDRVVALYLTNNIFLSSKNLIKVRLDIRDYQGLLNIASEFRPNVIIHTAALGDVDMCEKDKALAWSTNVDGSEVVTKIAQKLSSFLIYLSTDYVFDGQRGGYAEDDVPSPINYYGLTKLCGEIAVASLERFAIVRASTVYGFGPGRANFAKALLERLSKGERIKAVDDQYTSPTEASLLGEAISEIAERELSGVFHVAGERMSRYEFALNVARAFGLDSSLIEKTKMEEMSWLARRPRDSSLNFEKTKKILGLDFYSKEKAFGMLKREIESQE